MFSDNEMNRILSRIDLRAELTAAKTDCRQLYLALEWLVHIGHGVGKAGGRPESGEFEAAMVTGEALLESLKHRKE